MADYLVTDTELTSIADAIRTKGGTSAALTFPAGFVSAVNDIPTGGGGSSTLYVLTEAMNANTGCSVGNYTVGAKTAYYDPSIVEGATITLRTYSDYVLDTITGEDSGTTYSYTTVSRGQYTFTMPGESVYCSLYYDD